MTVGQSSATPNSSRQAPLKVSWLPWIVLGLLALSRASAGFIFSGAGALAPMMVPEFGISFSEFGFYAGAFLLPGIILSIPFGFLSRKIGDTKTLLIGLLVLAVGVFIVSQAKTFPVALTGRIFSGIGGVAILVLVSKMLSDWFTGKDLPLPMSILANMWPLGIGLGLEFYPVVGMNSNWHDAVTFSLVPVVAAFVFGMILHSKISANKVAAPVAGQVDTPKINYGVFGYLCASWALYGGIWAIIFGFGSMQLIAGGASITSASQQIAMLSWLAVVFGPLSGYIASKLKSSDAMIWIVFLLQGVGLIMLPNVERPFVLLFFIGAIGCIPGGLLNARAASVLPPAAKAVGFGVFWTCYFFGIAASSSLAGFVRDQTQKASAPLQMAGFMSLIAMVLMMIFLVMVNKKKK